MTYSVYVNDIFLAEQIVDALNRTYKEDKVLLPGIYDFVDLSERDMRKIKVLIKARPDSFIVLSFQSKEIIWPNRRGFTLEQALDLV